MYLCWLCRFHLAPVLLATTLGHAWSGMLRHSGMHAPHTDACASLLSMPCIPFFIFSQYAHLSTLQYSLYSLFHGDTQRSSPREPAIFRDVLLDEAHHWRPPLEGCLLPGCLVRRRPPIHLPATGPFRAHLQHPQARRHVSVLFQLLVMVMVGVARDGHGCREGGMGRRWGREGRLWVGRSAGRGVGRGCEGPGKRWGGGAAQKGMLLLLLLRPAAVALPICTTATRRREGGQANKESEKPAIPSHSHGSNEPLIEISSPMCTQAQIKLKKRLLQ